MSSFRSFLFLVVCCAVCAGKASGQGNVMLDHRWDDYITEKRDQAMKAFLQTDTLTEPACNASCREGTDQSRRPGQDQ